MCLCIGVCGPAMAWVTLRRRACHLRWRTLCSGDAYPATEPYQRETQNYAPTACGDLHSKLTVYARMFHL